MFTWKHGFLVMLFITIITGAASSYYLDKLQANEAKRRMEDIKKISAEYKQTIKTNNKKIITLAQQGVVYKENIKVITRQLVAKKAEVVVLNQQYIVLMKSAPSKGVIKESVHNVDIENISVKLAGLGYPNSIPR